MTKTTNISNHSLKNLLHGFAFAEQSRTPMTVWVTIRWKDTEGWSDNLLSQRMSHLLHRFARWCRRKSLPSAYLWVIENSKVMGLHAHAGFYVPKPLFSEFLQAFPGWVPGFIPGKHILAFTANGGEGPAKFFWHKNQRGGQLRYVLKGMNHKATFQFEGERYNLGAHIGIEHRGQQGTVPGKRCGLSESLGRLARARAGYVESSTPDALASIIARYSPANDNKAQCQAVANA